MLRGQGDTATAYTPPLPSHVLRPNAQQCLDLDASPLPLPVDQDLQHQASALLVPLSVLCAHKKAPLPAPSAPQLLALLRRFQVGTHTRLVKEQGGKGGGLYRESRPDCSVWLCVALCVTVCVACVCSPTTLRSVTCYGVPWARACTRSAPCCSTRVCPTVC